MSDWWSADPTAPPAGKPAAGGEEWWKADPVAQKQGQDAKVTPWSDVATQALRNAPESALNFGKSLVQPIMHPIATAEAVGNLANSVEDKAMNAIGVSRAPGFELSPETQALAGKVGGAFSDRYGGLENIKKTIATDPVGVLGDASMALTAGGGAVARLPGVLGKVGEAVQAVGDVANPIAGPVKAIGGAADEAARVGSKVNAPTSEALYDAASAAYDHPAIKDIAIKPGSVKTWKDTLLAENDVIDADLSPKTFNLLKRLDDSPAGSFFDGKNFQSLRRKLGQAAGSIDPTERKAASDAIGSLDDFLSDVKKPDVLRGDPNAVSAALKDARGNYAAAKRDDQIAGKLEAADLQAGSANSGMNLDNATRQRLKDVLKSDKQKRGFSTDELAQMRKIVVGTPVQNVTRRVANMLGGGGGIGALAAGGVGALAGGAAGHAELGAVLAGTAGYGLKKLSAAMTRGDVERLRETVRSRSPLGQQMQSSLGKYGKAATMLKGSPSATNIARFMLASRNLSTNLADAGITISPEDVVGTADSK